jgi:hypothetical protein
MIKHEGVFRIAYFVFRTLLTQYRIPVRRDAIASTYHPSRFTYHASLVNIFTGRIVGRFLSRFWDDDYLYSPQ